MTRTSAQTRAHGRVCGHQYGALHAGSTPTALLRSSAHGHLTAVCSEGPLPACARARSCVITGARRTRAAGGGRGGRRSAPHAAHARVLAGRGRALCRQDERRAWSIASSTKRRRAARPSEVLRIALNGAGALDELERVEVVRGQVQRILSSEPLQLSPVVTTSPPRRSTRARRRGGG
jgi:hypothetical protein